jgi:cysteine desulfurase
MSERLRDVYLDYAAATPLRPEVLGAMEPYFADEFGNPSSIHARGVRAKKAVEGSRVKIAGLLGALPDEVAFTGSGTEANNLALFGTFPDHRGPLITTPIEHSSVIGPAKEIERQGVELKIVEVDSAGKVDLADFKAKLAGVRLASVIYANNEIGTVQDLHLLSKATKRAGVLLHSDGCQAANTLPINVIKLGVDLFTLNAAKVGGPKGVGLLYRRRGVKLTPSIRGGGQERGLRASTENVAGIVGFARALELARLEADEEAVRLTKLRDYFESELRKTMPNIFINSKAEHRLPGIINTTFTNVDGEALLLYLDRWGVEASSGSACDAVGGESSHVLSAIGLTSAQIRSTIRFSLGVDTTKLDLDYTVTTLKKVLPKLEKR